MPENPKLAAGTLFVAPDAEIFLLRRASTEQNFAGYWGLPGGCGEDGETPEQIADRECEEEIGGLPGSRWPKKLLQEVRTPTGMVFSTFAQAIPGKFVPDLSDESSGYCWASLDQLPQPLHPAVKRMLEEQLGLVDEMSDADWQAVKAGFLDFLISDDDEEPSSPYTDEDGFLDDDYYPPELVQADDSKPYSRWLRPFVRWAMDAGEFKETEHPRDKSGQFSTKEEHATAASVHSTISLEHNYAFKAHKEKSFNHYITPEQKTAHDLAAAHHLLAAISHSDLATFHNNVSRNIIPLSNVTKKNLAKSTAEANKLTEQAKASSVKANVQAYKQSKEELDKAKESGSKQEQKEAQAKLDKTLDAIQESGYHQMYKPGSKKAELHKLFHEKGLAETMKKGEELGLSPASLKTWTSAWKKQAKEKASELTPEQKAQQEAVKAYEGLIASAKTFNPSQTINISPIEEQPKASEPKPEPAPEALEEVLKAAENITSSSSYTVKILPHIVIKMKQIGASEDDIKRCDELVQHGLDQQFVEEACVKIKDKNLPTTVAQTASLISYTGNLYKYLNESLRKGVIKKGLLEASKEINACLDKLPPYKGDVVRGTSLHPDDLAKYKVGHIIEERGFTSTATNGGFSGNVKYFIKSKTGRKIDHISAVPAENEVLFKAGSRFEVKKIEDKGSSNIYGKITHIYMEEV